MAETVGSAVVQEVVSGAFTFMRNSHEEMAAQSHLIERLKYANLELKFALERTERMPMIEVSLLQRRMMLKHVFEESRDLLDKQHTQRVKLEGEGAEQGVTLAPSLPNRIMHAVKPFFGTEKGSISVSCVRRFELFAEKTDKFVRDVESCFSLVLYRFSCPLVTQLLEGKYLHYEMVSGSQTRSLLMFSCCLEDYGAVATLIFEFKDLETPMKCCSLDLMVRLSESTDIVGISTKCLLSLEPQFKPVADVALGELAQIFTQVSVRRPSPASQEHVFNWMTDASRSLREEPLCCIGDGFQPSAKNLLSSKLTEWFPEQVSYLGFQFFISAAEYSLLSPTVETNRKTIKACPILQLSVQFAPHFLCKTEDEKLCGLLGCLDLSSILCLVVAAFFKLDPDQTEFSLVWPWAHGRLMFTVEKPTTEIGCSHKMGDGCKTRRVSKRKR